MSHSPASEATRWGQLIFGIICMVMIANLQYGWTLFVGPIDAKYHWGRALFRWHSRFLSSRRPGWSRSRHHRQVRPAHHDQPQWRAGRDAWVINSVADLALPVACRRRSRRHRGRRDLRRLGRERLKWFPDRRGLAAGLTAVIGAGSALTVIPIANMIQSRGYEAAFLWFGLAQGIVVVFVALRFARQSPVRWLRRRPQPCSKRGAITLQPSPQDARVLGHVCDVRHGGDRRSDGSRATGAHRHDFKVATIPVSLMGLTLPALPSPRPSTAC